ncbi:hypothetical protein GOP47_0027396 [Adiantum capillus-veneris]|nr:hypothetical protein GOP47_0027396 [Adiantum capillus-veneris]
MENLAAMPHFVTKNMEPDFLGLGLSLPPLSWPIACTFEINGCKVPASEEPISTLRRDRVDRESSEVTYVGTDRLRTTGLVLLVPLTKETSGPNECRRNTLDSIPEVEEVERSNSSSTAADIASQVEEHSFYQQLDCKQPGLLGGYMQDSYMEGEEGEITWFNAGVRVGVGIGLGMCVGIGIGVGLMMRAYQSTTRTLRRRLF